MSEAYFRQIQAHIAGNPKLWESQVQAYLDIKAYFEGGGAHPAIAVLPTGTGKTGLLAIAPYGIANQRVLVIAPGLIIKQTITRSLDPRFLDNFWLKQRVILSQAKLPYVSEFESGTKIDVLRPANFVITNIHMCQWSNPNSLMRVVPPDFFDMIIIDEAHHSPAQSWVDVERYFAGAKVLKLTGTPFRSDNEPIYGERVFNYPLGRAMARKIIKQLINETYLPDELTFQVRDGGAKHTISLQEALQLKDSEWVSRSVAYSPECSRLVVSKSLEIMRAKREATGRAHKIIAVAQNVAHAREVQALYGEAGATATIVNSHDSDAVNEANLLNFVNDRAQVIVNVDMLGEGFDHPLISVAAIFRPFRSLLPYAQFAGRALRAIPDGTAVDNTAHLVYHKALGLDQLWEYYQKEKYRADVIQHLEDLAKTGSGEEAGAFQEPQMADNVNQAGAIQAFVSSYVEDDEVMREYEKALTEAKQLAQPTIDALIEKGTAITEELLQAILAPFSEKSLAAKRPDMVYKERRKGIQQKVEDGVAEILQKHGLNPKASPNAVVWPTFAKYAFLLNPKMTLDGFLVALVNCQLKERIGRGRGEWSPDDFINAEPLAQEFLGAIDTLFQKGEQ